MLRHGFLLCMLFSGLWSGLAKSAPSATPPILPGCDPLTGCTPVITATKYQSKPAFTFNNGTTAAVVVPSLGRVMSFGLANKSAFDKNVFNWLWNNPSKEIARQPWKNWGGSKTWLAPQNDWPKISGGKWPPDAAWTKTLTDEVQTGGFLHTTSALSPHSGIRFMHQYGHEDDGSFFVRQTAEKQSGNPLPAALWSVTQINPPDAVFFLLNPKGTLEDSLLQLQGSVKPQLQQRGDLACYIPGNQETLKIGISTRTRTMAALHQNMLFVMSAAPQNALYPDATGRFQKGFPLEIFDSGATANRYVELEFLSPLRLFYRGSRWTSTVHWNIYPLPTSDLNSPQLWNAVRKILHSSL